MKFIEEEMARFRNHQYLKKPLYKTSPQKRTRVKLKENRNTKKKVRK